MRATRFLGVLGAFAFGLVGPFGASEAEANFLVEIKDQSPFSWVDSGQLIPTNDKFRKFKSDDAMFTTDDDREFPGRGTQKVKKNGTSTLVVKDTVKGRPNISAKFWFTEQGDVSRFKGKFKDEDKSKTKFDTKKNDVDFSAGFINPIQSDAVVADAVQDLLSGSNDFSQISSDFAFARQLDFTNGAARFFGAYANYGLWAQQEMALSNGTGRLIAEDAGFVYLDSPVFFHSKYSDRCVAFGEGEIPDNAPNSTRFADWNRLSVIPAHVNFYNDLELVPDDFEYRVGNVDGGGEFFDQNTGDDTEIVWVDKGEALFTQSKIAAFLAGATYFDAWNFDNLNPNDYDPADDPLNYDPFFTLQTDDDLFGTVRTPSRFGESRLWFINTQDKYRAGWEYLANESTEQRDNGLVAPYRDVFRGSLHHLTLAERDDDILAYMNFEAWSRDIRDNLSIDANYTFTTNTRGMTKPFGTRITTNFDRFFTSPSIDPRTRFLNTVFDPVADKTVLGVSSLDDFTSDDLTFGGAIQQFNDATLRPGDLVGGRWPLQLVQLNSVPSQVVDPTILDGDSTDWDFGNDSVMVLEGARAQYESDAKPDFGTGYAKLRPGDILLFWVVPTDDISFWSVTATSESGHQAIASSDGATGLIGPFWGTTQSGIEIGIPTANFLGDQNVKLDFMAFDDFQEPRKFRCTVGFRF